jgi:hypothetical protein
MHYNNHMKQHFTLFIALIALVISIGSTAKAATYAGSYRHPVVSAPGNNMELVPITESALNETKAGGLTVTTFLARAAAWISGKTFFGGYLRGGTVANANDDSTLMFGDNSHTVSLTSTGNIATAQTFQTDTLIPGPTRPDGTYVCADTDGTLIWCPDLCNNIDGVQASIPEGATLESNGSCLIDAVSTSANSCAYQLLVRKVDATHAKVNLQRNGSTYFYSPVGGGSNVVYVTIEPDDGAPRVIAAPRGQLASYDLGTSTTTVRVVDVDPGFIGAGEVCWSGY